MRLFKSFIVQEWERIAEILRREEIGEEAKT